MRSPVALEANRIAMQRAAHKFNAANLRVFGSALWGADREGGDLDLTVDPPARRHIARSGRVADRA